MGIEKQKKAQVGLIGLAVMGRNLALNMEEKGFSVALYNRSRQKTDDLLQGEGQGKAFRGTYSLEELCSGLERPRKIVLMVQAGAAVDHVVEGLLPFLEAGDILLDGGNSHFDDSQRRFESLQKAGILFVGMGVSGGEEGARKGPSLMPGGHPEAWPQIQSLLETIAAHTVEGDACTGWVGRGGAGHYVKMVHNGIEYGDMQIIAEAYDIMVRGLALSAPETAEYFQRWNTGKLESYLMEITARVLAYRLPGDKRYLVDQILDAAGQKGTGRWTAVNALEAGEPVSLISEAVMARFLSAQVDLRQTAAEILEGPQGMIPPESGYDRESLLEDLELALYGAKLVSYAQGFQLLRQASENRQWDLDFGGIAQMWRGGCIIRSTFLGRIKEAYQRNPDLENLLFDPYFSREMAHAQAGWRRITARALEAGIPVPALSSALSYYDGLRSARLPANLLQAQRDFFGAHTYERTDRPRGKFYHAPWTEEGEEKASGTYQA